jgi:hypothetical protein
MICTVFQHKINFTKAEKETPSMSTLLSFKTYILQVPHCWLWKGIHAACSYCWQWKRIHCACPQFPVVERDTPCMLAAKKDTTYTFILLRVEELHPACPHCCWCKDIPAAHNTARGAKRYCGYLYNYL